MNGITPLRLAHLFGASAIFAVTAVGVSQSPQLNGSNPGNPAPKVQVPDMTVPEYGHRQPGSNQLSGSEVSIAATAQTTHQNPRPAAGDSPFKRAGSAGEMIGFSHYDASGTQTITLVHTGKSWMAVYHIDRSGTIRLVSSRPIDADFSLQLNATSPLPKEIRQIGRR